MLPVQVLVEQFPAAYCTAKESGLGKLIHRMQNILLNIQMREEILARQSRTVAQKPPTPLPGRETPNHQRVAANFSHFHWWTEYLVAI